jgi:hypothetical protein
MTYGKSKLTQGSVSNLKRRLSSPLAHREHGLVAAELPDDATLIMEVLFDLRRDTAYIIELLEEDIGEEEAEDS